MIRYITLAEYLWLAEQVTGIDVDTLVKAARSDPADSALHAPQAGFGDVEFYPDLYDKAAVLVCRLAWNHPLPDENKRAAWAALVLFIDLNQAHGIPTRPRLTKPRQPCWRSRQATSTRPGRRLGCESASDLSTNPERGQVTQAGDGSQNVRRSTRHQRARSVGPQQPDAGHRNRRKMTETPAYAGASVARPEGTRRTLRVRPPTF